MNFKGHSITIPSFGATELSTTFQAGFDSQETKLPTYWNTSFSFSLYSLIADGQYRHTTLGPGTWKTLVGSQAALQPHYDKEGFNAVGDNTSIQNKNRHHR